MENTSEIFKLIESADNLFQQGSIKEGQKLTRDINFQLKQLQSIPRKLLHKVNFIRAQSRYFDDISSFAANPKREKLIKEASLSGANAVKFQKRTIDKVYSKEILDQSRESPWGNTQREQKYGLEFELHEYQEIDKYCKELNIDWFASAWDMDSLVFLKQFNLKFNKVASAMITDLELLKAISSEKKHTFISTGMSNITQIENAVNIFKEEKSSFELMHSVSSYPMPDGDANLKLISFLREKFNL